MHCSHPETHKKSGDWDKFERSLLTPYDDVSCFYDFTIIDRLRVARLPKQGWGRRDPYNKKSVWLWQCEMVHSPYLQVDRDNRHDTIRIDVDGLLDVDAYKAAGLPMPRGFTARKRTSSDTVADRPHLIFDLKYTVRRKNRKQAAFRNAIRERLIAAIRELGVEVDDSEPGVTKNPAHDHWTYFAGEDREWTLTELADCLDTIKIDVVQATTKTANDGPETPAQRVYERTSKAAAAAPRPATKTTRNVDLFNAVRPLVYAAKAAGYGEQELLDYAHEMAESLNEQMHSDNPLDVDEVQTVANSIGPWTWANYTEGGNSREVDRGACADQITAAMSKPARQAVGGRYGANRNAEKHLEAICEAIQGRSDYTVSGLARELGMSRNTVRKYLDQLAPEAAEPTPEPRPIVAAQEVVKTVSSGGRAGLPPDLRINRDGVEWSFWHDPDNTSQMFDQYGDPCPVWIIEKELAAHPP